jgi:hypothetical protein
MLNVDGTVYGNSRTDLAGYDVNRQWTRPHEVLQPQVAALKALLASRTVRLAIDLHGHSKQLGCFAYCCSSTHLIKTAYFPYLLSKRDSNFKFWDCTFGITPDKISTARATIFSQLKSECITIETSFFGP